MNQMEGLSLTDNVINAAQILACRQFPQFSGFQDTVLGIKLLFRHASKDRPTVQILHTGTYVHNKIHNCATQWIHIALKPSWDYYQYCLGYSHWVCTSCISPGIGPGPVNVMDSMNALEMTQETILQIACIYKPQGNILELQRLPVQQQRGSHDCGVFAIAYMIEVCNGNNVEAVSFNQARMRNHLRICLENGVISPFPKATRKISAQKSQSQVIREVLYCQCKMPDFYDERMISCDKCSEWFHCSCMNIAKRHKRASWICPGCTESTKISQRV